MPLAGAVYFPMSLRQYQMGRILSSDAATIITPDEHWLLTCSRNRDYCQTLARVSAIASERERGRWSKSDLTRMPLGRNYEIWSSLGIILTSISAPFSAFKEACSPPLSIARFSSFQGHWNSGNMKGLSFTTDRKILQEKFPIDQHICMNKLHRRLLSPVLRLCKGFPFYPALFPMYNPGLNLWYG